jgi:hypothetical protein
MGGKRSRNDEDPRNKEISPIGQLRTLKYDIAVLKQWRPLLGCLGRKTSRIF